MSVAEAARCPNCYEYIGRVAICPYCGTTIKTEELEPLKRFETYVYFSWDIGQHQSIGEMKRYEYFLIEATSKFHTASAILKPPNYSCEMKLHKNGKYTITVKTIEFDKELYATQFDLPIIRTDRFAVLLERKTINITTPYGPKTVNALTYFTYS